MVVVDEEWSTRLEKAIEVDETVQGLLRKEIKNLSRDETAGVHDIEMSDENGFTSDSGLFVSYLQLIFDAFSGQYFNSGIASDIIYGSTLTRLLSLSPTKGVVSKLATDSSREKYIDLLSMLLNDIALTELAQAIGIIFSSHAVSDADCVQLLSKLNEAPKAALGVKSKLIANAYLISRLSIRNRIHLLTSEFLSTYLSNVLKGLKEPQSYSLTLDCISQLSIFGVLAIQEHGALVAEIKEELLKRVKKGDENAVITLSYLSLVLPKEVKENDELTDLEKAVYDTHVTKQTEFIFSSGESLAILAAGWQSTILQRQLDIHDDNSIEIINRLIPEDTSRLPIILEMVFKSCANTKPSLRRSGCIWLLSLVQYVGHLKPIRDNAAKIHVSFMRFLADRDELIQELASRGLSLVYEMGDYDLKDTLVKGLLKSFTESGSTANNTGGGSVDLETQLFDPDVLKTNDGSISTYKDVLNLASDVGDPSLVYKFMSLAKSSSLWSSRKGMAFGLGSILSKTSLDEMLQNNKTLALRLIPKLYRYKFDPSTSVSKAMQDIWNVLIKDSLKTIDENLDNILQELLKSMGNKEWRVRQALTTALIDLLQVTTLDKYESKLEEIWNMSFRVMDDIKESVRKEGNKLTKSLATTITRRIEKSANSDTTSDKTRSSEFLSSLIPFLLGSKGLLSDAEDIRNFALETILKLVKVGGSTMKPFIPELIDNFINLMSTLEPQIVNYLVLNADKYNLKNDEIDARRLQSVGASPMMDAIEKMLDQVDDLMMDQFVSRLQSSIKKSIGLPLKVCGSKVLVLLVTRHLQLIKPYGDKLLKICINQIGDKNDTIALSYAASAGYLCRVCSTRAIVDYAQHLQKLYFDLSIGNERHRIVCSIASESVAKYSKDKFESIAKSFLPLAFLGKHDPLEVVKSNFEREWIENTSGNLSIKLYLPEIIELSQAHLNTSRLYEIRQVIASSIADLVSSIDIGSVEFANSTITSQLFELLLEGSKGKSWSGKEYIVEALVLFSIKCKPALLQDQDLLEKIEKTIIVEIKRRNKVYQKQVLKFAAKFIFNFNQKELISTYISIMEEFVSDRDDVDDSDDSDDDAMEIDSGSRNQKSNIDNSVKLEEQRLVLIKGLFESFNPKVQDDGDDSLAELVFKLIINLFQTPKFSKSWRSKLACCESILKVITEFSEDLTPTAIQFIFEDWEILSKNCLGLKDIENIKVNFIRLSKCVIGIVDDEKKNKVKSVLRDFKSNESSNVVITELNSVL